MLTHHEIWQELQERVPSPPQEVNLPVLIDFFWAHSDLFYEVAVTGVPEHAAPWAHELARLALQVRQHVYAGYEIVEDRDGGEVRSAGVEPIIWKRFDPSQVRTFLRTAWAA